MDITTVKKHIGKSVLLILKNNYQYTCVIPEFDGSSFEITDKFGMRAYIECEFIAFIKEQEVKGR